MTMPDKPESLTPRTDLVAASCMVLRSWTQMFTSMTDHAKQLELELAEANARIKALDPYGRGVVTKGEEF